MCDSRGSSVLIFIYKILADVVYKSIWGYSGCVSPLFLSSLFSFCLAQWIYWSPLPLTNNAVSYSVFAIPFFVFLYIHFTRNARLENSPFARHMDFIATKHDIDKTPLWNPCLVLLCRSSEFAVWPFALLLTSTCVLIYAGNPYIRTLPSNVTETVPLTVLAAESFHFSAWLMRDAQ